MLTNAGGTNNYGLLFSASTVFGIRPAPGATLTLMSSTAGTALTVASATPNIVHHGTFGAASDARLKDDIQEANSEDCQQLFDAVAVKTYKRKDHETDKYRVGYVAQDVQAALPADGKFQNLVTTFTHGEGDDKVEMLAVDYSRLSCILWSVVKKLQTRVEALEAPKKKTAKSKA